MRLGMHVHVATGYSKAVEHAKALGATAMQVFSSNPRSYRTSAIDPLALDDFARLRLEADLDPCAIHTPYLINLASADPKIWQGSVNLLKHDLAVAARGGMRFVNTHLGSYGTRDRSDAFADVCRALESTLAEIGQGVFLVLENSAGAGNLAGGTLEELGAFVRALPHPQLGICL